MRFKSFLSDLTTKSQHHRYLHAAVVAKGKSILGYGVNTEGHHAEANALYSVGLRAKGATLYTLMRKRKTGKLGDGTPCSCCMALIKAAKLRKVVIYV